MDGESAAASKDEQIVQLKTQLLELKNSQLAALNHRVGLILQYQSYNSDTKQLYQALAEIYEKLRQIASLNSQIADLQQELQEKTQDITKLKLEKEITEAQQFYQQYVAISEEPATCNTSQPVQQPAVQYDQIEADEVPERPIKMPEKLPERQGQTSTLIKQLRAQRSYFLKEISELREENRSLREKQSKEELKERAESYTVQKYGALLRSHTYLQQRIALLAYQNEDLRALAESTRIYAQKASLSLSPGARTSPSVRQSSQISGQCARSSILSSNGDAAAKIEQLKALNQQQKGRIDQILKDKNQLFAKNQTLVLEMTRLKTALQDANRRLERLSRVFMDQDRMYRGAGDLKRRLLALKVHLHKDNFSLQIDKISKANQRYLEISAFKLRQASQEGYEARTRLAWTANQLEYLKIARDSQALASRQAIYYAREEWDQRFKHLFVQYMTLSEEVPLLTQCEEFLKQQSQLISERFSHFDERIRDLAAEVDVFDAEMLRGTTALGQLQATIVQAADGEVEHLQSQLAEREQENQQREEEISELKRKAAEFEESQREFEMLEQQFALYRTEDLKQLEEKELALADLAGKLQTTNSALEKTENLRAQLEEQLAALESKAATLEQEIAAKTRETEKLKDALKQPQDQKQVQLAMQLEERSAALARTQRYLDTIYAEQREYIENMEKTQEEQLGKLRSDIEDSEKRTAAARQSAEDNLYRLEEAERYSYCLKKQLNEQQTESRQALLSCYGLLQKEISSLKASLAEAENYVLTYYSQLKLAYKELQQVYAQRQHDEQQMTLRIDEYAGKSADQEHKIQQLTNNLAEQYAAAQCVCEKADKLQQELSEEKQRVLHITEYYEHKLQDISAELQDYALKYQQLTQNLEDAREKLSVAHQAKNDEVRGLLVQVGALYREIENYKLALTDQNDRLYELEGEKLDLIYRCSQSTQECQTLGDELKRSRDAVSQLQLQLSERKASKNSYLQYLSRQNESLSDEVRQLREDNSTLQHNVKQQILLMQKNCEQREAELQSQLHAREVEVQDLHVSVEKARQLCSSYQIALETAENNLLTNMISGAPEQQNYSEAYQRIREQLEYNAVLQQRVELLEKEKGASDEKARLAVIASEKELADLYSQLSSLQAKLYKAEEMIAAKESDLTEEHASQLRQTQSYLAYIDELGAKLISKDDEMAQLQHEVEALSAQKLSQISKQMDLQTELQNSIGEVQQLRAQLAQKQTAKAAKTELAEQIAQLSRQAAESAQARAASENQLTEQVELFKHKLQKAEAKTYQAEKYNEALLAENDKLNALVKEMQDAQNAASYLRLQNQAQEIASLNQEVAGLKQKNEQYRKELAERAADALAMSAQAGVDQHTAEYQNELLQRVKCDIRRFEADNEGQVVCAAIQERAFALSTQISGLHERIHTAFKLLAEKGPESALYGYIEALVNEKQQLVQRQVHLQEQLYESHSMQALYQQQLLAAQDQINEMQQTRDAGPKRRQARK